MEVYRQVGVLQPGVCCTDSPRGRARGVSGYGGAATMMVSSGPSLLRSVSAGLRLTIPRSDGRISGYLQVILSV